MRVALALLWILTLVGTFAAGRHAGSQRDSSLAAFREALLARDELTRSDRMSAFFQQLDTDTLPAALEAIEAHSVGMSRQEVRLFLLAWSRFDAPGAFAWARDWKTPWRDTLMPEAIYAWGFRDARAALRELDAIDDPTLLARLRPSLFEGWLRSDDRSGASEAIAAIDDPRQRGRLTFLLAGETMRDGPEHGRNTGHDPHPERHAGVVRPDGRRRLGEPGPSRRNSAPHRPSTVDVDGLSG